MKSRRLFAVATSVFAIALAVMPNDANALRASGGSKVKYLSIASQTSSTATTTSFSPVAMAIDIFLWFPTPR